MRPFVLKGHERPLTQLKYNKEGDLLVTCSKDQTPTLWFAEDGARIGRFLGHKGSVNTCDLTWDSSTLITASSDSRVKLWDVQTGECKYTFEYNEPCRAVAFSLGEQLAALTNDPFIQALGCIRIVRIAEDASEQTSEEVLKIGGSNKRFTRVTFHDLNRKLLTSGEDGFVRSWDVETGKQLAEKAVHTDSIGDLQMANDCSHFVTASKDKTAKLVDAQTLEVMKTYATEYPVNTATISPIEDHVLIGGGQEASQVTTTGARSGNFQSRFFHKIYAEEFGSIRGHFGPINALKFHPDGRSFTSGGEDGYVRVHHLDSEYLGIQL